MSPATEIRLIALRELRRSVRSAKGIAVSVITLLGALVASLAAVWIEGGKRAESNAASTQAFVELKRGILEQTTGDAALAAFLAPIPTSLLIFAEITVFFLPLLVALFGFDVISGELQHREVRFWTVRARRESYFVAKLVGLWALIGLVTLVLNLLAGCVALTRGYVTVGELVAWGTRFWLMTFMIAGAWCAIAVFVSSCVKTPILALLATFATFFASWICGVGGLVSRQRASMDGGAGLSTQKMRWFEYLYPNSYDKLLLSPETVHALTAVAALLGFVVVACIAGSLLFRRRDV